MRSGIERAGKCAAGLANSNSAHSATDNDDAQGQKNWPPGEQGQCKRCAPVNFGIARRGCGAGGERLAIFHLEIEVANEDRYSTCDHSNTAPKQQILEKK